MDFPLLKLLSSLGCYTIQRRCHSRMELRDGAVEGEDLLFFDTECPQCNSPLRALALSDHGDDRNLGQAVLANLVVDLLVAQVDLGA